jgi:hypothetical protein
MAFTGEHGDGRGGGHAIYAVHPGYGREPRAGDAVHSRRRRPATWPPAASLARRFVPRRVIHVSSLAYTSRPSPRSFEISVEPSATRFHVAALSQLPRVQPATDDRRVTAGRSPGVAFSAILERVTAADGEAVARAEKIGAGAGAWARLHRFSTRHPSASWVIKNRRAGVCADLDLSRFSATIRKRYTSPQNLLDNSRAPRLQPN